MAIAQSKVTAQGQVSVPAEVRRRLGIGPGSVLEWDEQGGCMTVRKAGRHSSAEVHAALFQGEPPPAAAAGVKEGIRAYMRKRHARG